jgi:hypothetical protein
MWWKYYVLMYENGKERDQLKLFQRRREGIKENDGGDEFNHDIL